VPPFEDLMNSFQAEHGIEPDIFMRVASADQCPAVDFLRSVKPLAEAGPRLNVENTQVARGQRLAGNLQAISGWKSDVLLVDDAGIVHTVALSPSSSGAAATFSAPLTTTASGDVPMIVISISSRDGLITPASVEGVPASTAFPAILREVQQKGSDVAVGVKYVKLE
jgi:hypothetical protein